MKQAIRENLAGGAEPRGELIEQGEGWWCYLASNVAWSGCWRTVDKCNDERSQNTQTARTKGESITFGACQQAAQAACVTYERMTLQSNGSSKPEPAWDCMPDAMTCSKFAEGLRGDVGNSHVSKCLEVK